MTFRSPTFERLVSAGATRLSRELSIAAKEKIEIFIVAIGSKDLRIDGTASFSQLDAVIPEIVAACAEVA